MFEESPLLGFSYGVFWSYLAGKGRNKIFAHHEKILLLQFVDHFIPELKEQWRVESVGKGVHFFNQSFICILEDEALSHMKYR